MLREGHTGVPLLHLLPKGRLRLYYAAVVRLLGLGYRRDDRPIMTWAADQLDYLDRWTVYRSIEEVHAVFGRNAVLRHREIDYCRFRAEGRRLLGPLLRWSLTRRAAEALFRRLAFEAIEGHHPPAAGVTPPS